MRLSVRSRVFMIAKSPLLQGVANPSRSWSVLAVRVGADGAGEGAERARADRTVLLGTAEGVAVAHVAELPDARATDPGLSPVRVEVPRTGWRQYAVLTRLGVAAGDELSRAVVG